ncbi:MAG: T9SS type A sorting domain-containing protein [Chitinophagaceae bacterium]
MKRILLSNCLILIVACAAAQPCVTFEGLGPVHPTYGINVFGQAASNFPVVPLYWNRFYKTNELTGQIEPMGCAYPADPNIHELGACACILSGFYFRKVTPSCDPTPCDGDVDLPRLPKTDNNSASNSWSAGASWVGGQVPDISSSLAIMVTKSTLVDADITVSENHWLLFSDGSSSILAGKTVTLNSVMQIKSAAQVENFGTLKGNGQIFGSLTNSGILSPGNSPGRFTIVGNYTATASAVHQLEIAAANLYDTISIAEDISAPGGVAALNGTLTVGLLNSFNPSSGDSYKIMTYTSATGTFTNVNLPSLRNGLSWVVNYNAADITLQVTGVLPVTISSFKIDKKDNGVQAVWTTESEINVKNYEVERSADGAYFSKAGSINANAGITNRYSWFDASPLAGKNYYRIKSIDIDGKFSYSKILVINNGDNNKIAAYPNPVKRGDVLQLNLQNSTAAKIEITNTVGQVLYSKTGKVTGNLYIPVPSTWLAGQYVLTVVSENKLITQKILIR